MLVVLCKSRLISTQEVKQLGDSKIISIDVTVKWCKRRANGQTLNIMIKQ